MFLPRQNELQWIVFGIIAVILAIPAVIGGVVALMSERGKRWEAWWRTQVVLWGLVAVFAAVWWGRYQLTVKPAKEAQAALEQARYDKGKALFDERCKTSGVFIHRTVENVEGVFLIKLRPKKSDDFDQYAIDPYGNDLDGDGYIESFIRGSYDLMKPRQTRPGWPLRKGYLYVEAIDPTDGKRYRYTGRIDEPWRYDSNYSDTYKRFVLDKNPAPGKPPRYGVTYDDISTPEERQYWVVGSSLKVVDMLTNEVLAVRIGYMWDPGQGSRAGNRAPWLEAADHACPDFDRFPNAPVRQPASLNQAYQSDDFVELVLKPRN